MTKLTKIAFGAVALAAIAAVTPAHAGGSDYKLTIHKADLAHDAGLRRTVRLIEKYADSHCGVTIKQSLALQDASRACADALADEIVAKIDNPQLTRRHAGRVRIVRR
ncbi:MAG: UrcA family protein [Pseudomonadota bacterium]